jgi:hypothetical protein
VRFAKAVRAEDLDAVVVVRVVARADDDARVGAHVDREVRHRGRRHGTAEDDAPSHRADAGGEGRLDHVTRQPRVLADEDARRVRLAAPRDEGDRAPDAQEELGHHRMLVGLAADAVGAEELRHPL